MKDNEIWNGITSNEETITHKNGIAYHNLNRNNLSIYMNEHDTSDINEASLLDFFSIDNLRTFDEATGWYLSHLLFYRKFDENKLEKMLELVFKYVSIYQGTEKEGYSYLHTLFMQHTPYSNEFVFNVIEQAKKLGMDFTHQAFDGSTFYHWAVLYSGYSSTMELLNEHLPEEFKYNKYYDEQDMNINKLIKLIKIFTHCYYSKEVPEKYKESLFNVEIKLLDNYFELIIDNKMDIRIKNTPLYNIFFQNDNIEMKMLVEKNGMEFRNYYELSGYSKAWIVKQKNKRV